MTMAIMQLLQVDSGSSTYDESLKEKITAVQLPRLEFVPSVMQIGYISQLVPNTQHRPYLPTPDAVVAEDGEGTGRPLSPFPTPSRRQLLSRVSCRR